MEEYWVTFRLAAGSTYEKRYQSMLDAMVECRNGSWGEPTSFWLVSTNLTIDAFIKKLTAGLSASTDLVVVRNLAKDNSRYFGKVDHLDVLKGFLPLIKTSG
jgi:hypothetical protein